MPPPAVNTTDPPGQNVVGPLAEMVAVPCALTVTDTLAVVAQATDGVKVYVLVPAAAVLIEAGLQVPAIPLFEVAGNAAGVAPMQYGP